MKFKKDTKRFDLIDLAMMFPAFSAFAWAVFVRLGGSINFLISLFIR